MGSKVGPQIFAALSATSMFVSIGFQFGWIAPSLPKLRDKNSDLYVTSDQGSWIVSLLTVGSIFGSLVASAVVDRWGRKLSLMLTAIPMLSSCILIAVAQNYRYLYAARFIGGFGSGLAFCVMPMYVGEIADDRIRGALSSLMTLMTAVGCLLTYSIGPWVNRIVLPVLASVVPILFLSTFAWVPETPYYYIMRGKEDEAEKSLVWLRGRSDVKEELVEITKHVNFDNSNRGTIGELVTRLGNRKALVIVGGLLCAQQLSGLEAIVAYSGLIFKESGSTFNSNIAVIITGLIMFSSCALGVFLVDKLGRRPLLMFSVCCNILFLTGEALYFHLQAFEVDVTAISWLPITAIFGFLACHPIGLGDLPYVILSEMFPCNVKAIAVTVMSIWGSIVGTTVSKLYQVVADAYGIHVSFWCFVISQCFFAVFIFIRIPETKGRSLRDIQDELLDITAKGEIRDKLTA